MEAINYAPDGQNMILTDDAQIVPGISGNACYLPAGTGTIALQGNRNELSLSLWRQWDGIVEQYAPRGLFSFENIQVFFDSVSDFLTVVINDFKTITDIKDDQKQAHWCFTFTKNDRFTVYKNAKEVYSLVAGNKPVDMTDGFTLGGGFTHATFDEVRIYKTVLTQGEINGLFYLISKGTQVKQLESMIPAHTPKYLGVTKTVLTTRTAFIIKGEKLGTQDANPGDWVLMDKTVGGWKCGVCYRWTGGMWINLEPEYNYAEQYQAALYHICEIPELMQNTGHFGALFAKVLVAQKALIDKLVAQEAFINKLAANQAFLRQLVVQQLKIDSDPNSKQDFEAWFDKDNGLLIKNNNQEVFKVTPNGFAFMKNAKFEGEIDCQGFKVLNGKPTQQQFLYSWNAGDNAFTVFQKITTLKDSDFLNDNHYYYDTPLTSGHVVDGYYGNTTIRYIKCEQWTNLGILNIRVTLYNNNGAIVEKISGGKNKQGTTSNGISNGSWEKWQPSQYDAIFYTYNPSQKVIIPNISFGKSSEANVLYRDENGFVKIS